VGVERFSAPTPVVSSLTLKTNRIGLQSQRAPASTEVKMQFLLAVFLFVVVVGLIDLRVPWPKPQKRSAQP
jgi:hypothetical protein